MVLSDAKAKAATVPEGKKQIRLSDGGGLYLQVTPKGKYWRMNYRFGSKQKTLAIGVYPQVTLKEARLKREAAKKLLEQNIDPVRRNRRIDARRSLNRKLLEQGWDPDVIERQLAHKEGNAIKGAYNHARHLPERVKLMQHWANYLDGLRDGAEVTSINRKP